MLSSATAPQPPPADTKPRPRSHTFASPFPPPDRSPTFTRSYHQPVGSGSQRRMRAQSGHLRTRSQGDAVAAASLQDVGKGKRRAVFCDVVLDELELDEDGTCIYPTGPANAFLNSLGTPVTLPDPGPSQPQPVRPVTPGKTPKVDYDKVRQNLHELWVTEESYLRKMSSLLKDFAAPLRAFSKKRDTAIIGQFEATHLFINLEQLVPIAESFERDMRQLVGQLNRDKLKLPDGFGEVILRHVERMEPYKKWLSNVAASEAIRQNLEKTNSSFREFVERTQVHSRETAQTTGGFKEFLAEPFQRISRYRLMVDPIVFHLPPDNPNVEPLQIAAGILTDICSMRVDDVEKKAAVFWSLKETIEGFPYAMVGFDREFIGCIDADEVIEVTDSRPTTLRSTLFLFNDSMIIAKRPSGDKSGKTHAGLDDLDRLVTLYQTSHLSSTQASLLGSPKKLRKGALGFRGLVNLSEVVAVDLGGASSGPEFGLMFDQPPMDQSERWCGRPARKFVVASTYPEDVRRPEKDVFLGRFAETVLQAKLRAGARKAIRGRRAWDGEGVVDSTEVYWALWDRRTYERLDRLQRGKLALYIKSEPCSAPVKPLQGGRPLVSASATFLDDSRCRFDVVSNDPAHNTGDTISVDRIAGAVAELGFSYGLFSFPTLRPLPLSERPARPRSNLLSVAKDVFGVGSGLKRGNSMTSRTSSAVTSTVSMSNPASASASPRSRSPFSPAAALFSSSTSTQPALSQSVRVPLTKKSAPDLYGSMARRSQPTPEPEEDAYGGLESEEVEMLDESVGSLGPAPGRARRAAGRRSLSLPPPPPQGHFASPTPSPDRGRAPYDEDVVIDAHDPSPMMDADEPSWPMPQELEAPTTSPMAFRPHFGSTRRRMIGPRDMRPSPSAAQDTSLGYSSPSDLPFARSHSPTPQRRAHTSNTSTVTYASSPAYSDTADVSANDSQPSSSKRSRPPVEASPRPTPAKKVASLGGDPRRPSLLQQPPLFPAGRKPSGSPGQAQGERRIPSSASIGRIHIRSRRVTSGASTVRGLPSPPKPSDEPDVFSEGTPPMKVERKAVPLADLDDVPMAEDDDVPPFQRLRQHIDHIRLRLAREVANKENERIVSPTSLSRSPHTRNVFAKSLGDAAFSSPGAVFSGSNAFTTFSEPRARPAEPKIDLAHLSRWVRQLADLVETCEAAANAAAAAAADAAKPPSPDPVNDGAALELAMLEQERDLLAADLAALKEELSSLVQLEIDARKALEASQGENLKLRHAYAEICQEAEGLLADFNSALEDVTLAAQAEPDATGEYVDLTLQLRDAVSARFQAEHDLRTYRREVQTELDEKARWGELLRQHGLLPASG
ncbi:hypothetical protein JCM10207_004640 [Rhodosporidiobolus poonsookiae]